MRLIDADAAIDRINKQREHLQPDIYPQDKIGDAAYRICAEFIERLPSAQPNTTTHDSIPAETGKNDGDGTSGDCISRQMAIDALKEKVFHNLSDEFYGAMQVLDELPSAQPELDIWNDGTLHISVSKGQLDKIGRVLVEENGTIFCKLFYQDAEPERKTGHWILDRSGAYCCSKCMEPCAGYVMMKPRDKFCKMCGSRNEVME